MADLFSEYDGLVKQADKPQRLPASLYSSVDTSPDAEATLHHLSKKTGIPLEGLRNDNGADAKRIATVQAADNLHIDAPSTASFLSDPENAKISHDDIDALANIEKLARSGFGKQGGSTLGFGTANDQRAAIRAKSIGGAFVNSLLASPEKVNEGLASTGVILADFVDWSLAAFPDESGMRKKVADTARESKKFWSDAADKKMGKFAPQSAESYFSQAGSSIGTSLLAAPFGMGGEGAALGMFGLFADGGYDKMREKGVSMPVAGALSLSNSAMEGLTEKLGLDALYKGSAPVLKKAVQFVVGDLAGEEINTLYNALVDKVTITPDMTMGDVVQQVIDTAIVTSIAGPAQGLGTHSAAKASEKLYGQYQQQQEAKRQSDFLIALGDSVKASKTFARLPEKVQELVKQIKQDGDVQDVYVPVERFTELFQSQGMDPRQAAEQILSDPSRYHEAVATGGDVAIPLEEFARLADAPFYGELAKDARTSLTGMTAREAEAFGNDHEQTVNDLLAHIAEEKPPVEDAKYQDAYQRIYDDTYGQLIGVNQNPSEAQANATLRAKGLATLAQRYGYDADTLMAQFPIAVTRGDLPAALQRQPSFTEQQQTAKLTEMLDALRTGKPVKESEMFGPSLGELLREKGVKDDRGDLASMDVDKGLKFKKKMLRKDGISLDRARELAVERGYLSEDATTNNLLEAIDSELRGQPKYSPEFTNYELQDKQLAHDELAQWLDAMGLDLNQMPNDQVLEMMQQSISGGTQLFQPGTEAFDKWFKNSKVVDENGEPLIMYHGTSADFTEFSPEKMYSGEGQSQSGSGFYFTSKKESASNYASMKETGGRVMPVYLSIQKPLTIDFRDGEVSGSEHTFTKKEVEKIIKLAPDINSPEDSPLMNWGDIEFEGFNKIFNEAVKGYVGSNNFAALRNDFFGDDHAAWLKALNKVLGYDGALSVLDDGTKHYVAWFPTQIKSAIGNRGTYDPNDPNILHQEGRGSAEGHEALSVRKTQAEGMLLTAVMTDGVVKVAGIGATHYDVKQQMKVETPNVLYRGDSASEDGIGKGSVGDLGKGIYFVSDSIAAEYFTDGSDKSHTRGFQVTVENPFDLRSNDIASDPRWLAMLNTLPSDPEIGQKPKQQLIKWAGGLLDVRDNYGFVARSFGYDTDTFNDFLAKHGFDAVTDQGIRGVSDSGTQTVVFDKSQVKAADTVQNANGFVTPDNKFLDRKQALVWLKENRPDVYKQLDKVTKQNGLESQDYAHAEGVTTDTDKLINSFMARTFGTSPQMLFQAAFHGSPQYNIRKIISGEWGVFTTDTSDLVASFKTEGEARAFIPDANDKNQRIALPTGVIAIHRGEYSGNKGGGYFTPDKEFAIQFTQSGQEKEIITRYIDTAKVYKADTLPKASDEADFDNAIKEAKEKGYDAVWFDEGKGQPASIYVIDKKILKRKMEQANKDKKRGYIKFGDSFPGFEIGILKDADASTFAHEMAHYYHEVLGRLATSEGAPDALKADYQTLLDWLGATDKQSLTVEQSEKFARGFEAYLYEGKAPSQELRGVFQRFKTWLKAVYASMKSLNVELTDDVRGVFDRLLATDEEIAAAEKEMNIRPVFATAKEAGMSEAVFAAYLKLAADAHEDAKDQLERSKLKEVKRTHEAWWKEARQKMAEEVEAEAKQEPVYEALNFLYTGKLFDGSTFEGQSFKLSGADLVKMYDAATVKGMRKRLGDVYRKEGGLSPHVVAEMFGFSSADEMMKKMMESPKLKEYVKHETDRRMNEVHGKMNTAEIADEAINAVHNEDQAKLLREELKAIRRKVKEVKPFVQAEGKAAQDRNNAEREYERRWMDAEKKLAVAIERGAKQAEIDDLKESIRADKERARSAKKMAAESIPPIEFFKEAARRHIDGLKVSEILPGKFGRAEAKAGKEAFDLNGKGKFAEAAQAKQRQLLNHFLYREALEARRESEKISAYMRGLEAGKVQQRIGKAGQDYLEQVNALLDKYEFRRQTGAELEARESLLDWMDRYEKKNGFPPPVAPSVMEEAKQVNYRSLSMGELRDVAETVEAIVYLARTEGKLLQDGLKRDIIEVAEEGAASIEANSKGLKPRKPEKSLPQDLPGKYMENYFASHRKMSSLARQMDGGQDGGAIWNMLIRPMNVAGDREAIMRAEAATKLNEVFRVYSGLERTKMHMREFIPEINTSLSKWGRIMVALNMGNEGNRQRLASMYSTTEVEAIVSTLDQRDWQFVQNVWDMLESYWPEIEAKEKRVNGVAPQKVETMPVVTKFGTIQGGYFPIKYDREETAKTGGQEEAEVYRQMMGGAFTKATTRHGHLEARLEAVNRPLSFSIDTVFQHFNQVIHDLTHHEMLLDVNRLLGTTQLQEAIRDHYGMEAYKIFSEGVRDVAVGDIPAQDVFEKFMGYTRVGISTAGLGYNIVTSMMQPLGLTQSIVRIGPRWVGKGIGRWIGSPKRMIDTCDWIYEQSDFMKTRAMTQNREIAEIANQMTVGLIPNSVRDSFFYLIQQCQKLVDTPTWLGQYEKSMDAHGNEADAIAEADQAVIDSQASGQMKDLARIQRGGPMKKMFTTFYSFFSTTYNLAAESAGKTHFKNPSEVGRFMVDMLMLYTVPVVLTVALKESVQRAIGGGDDDDEELLKKLAGEQLGYITGGFVGLRELGSMFSGFQGYEGPAGARVYSSSIKLFKQIGQGELDEALFKAANSLGGVLFHYPATQVQRVVDGMKELNDGRGNLLSLLFGKPKKN